MRVIDEEKFANGLMHFPPDSPDEKIYRLGLTTPLSEDGWADFSNAWEVDRITNAPSSIYAICGRLQKERLIDITTERGGFSIRWDYIIPHFLVLDTDFEQFKKDMDWDSSMPLDEFYEAFQRAQKGD